MVTRGARAAILALHALTFAALTWWSWQKWCEPIIDFGRELYLPWQITQGRVLYRDLASLFGPLSPYVNALWFRLFGDSLLTLALCNLAIFAALLAAIYHLVRITTDRLTATVAGLTTLLLFGFSQYVDVANYNYVTPYSHEATHGLALSVAMILCLYNGLSRRRLISFSLAGTCFGLVMLTKPDTSLAAIAAALTMAAGIGVMRDRDRRDLVASSIAFLVAAAVPPLLFLLYFSMHMPATDAIRAVSAAWLTTLGTNIASNSFYQRVMGLDRPWNNALHMIYTFA